MHLSPDMPIAIHSEKKKAGRHYKKNTAFPFLTKGLKLRATFSLLPVSLLLFFWLLVSLPLVFWLLVSLPLVFWLPVSLPLVFSSQLPWDPPLIFKILRTSHSPSVWKIILA